ncbi:MAG: hypothetical protein GEU89_21100, partial [Kiloniellaceae bacterium]|nr:hypothetical protein [Kiloniellaceae bacterium]
HHHRAVARWPSPTTARFREPGTPTYIQEARTSTRVAPVRTAAACAARRAPTSTSTSTGGTGSIGRIEGPAGELLADPDLGSLYLGGAPKIADDSGNGAAAPGQRQAVNGTGA